MGTISKFLQDPARTTRRAVGMYGSHFPRNSALAATAVHATMAMTITKSQVSLAAPLEAMPNADPAAAKTLREYAALRFSNLGERAAILLRRYEETHIKVAPSEAPAPKRAARSD
jgi:hypothetical protein